MKAWIVFATGGVAGATLVTILAGGVAHSDTADTARIAALEARLDALQASLNNRPGDNLVLTTPRGMDVSAGKKISVIAGDEISLVTGAASLRLRKSGAIEIKGSDIIIQADQTLTAKQGQAVVLKGSKIGSN